MSNNYLWDSGFYGTVEVLVEVQKVGLDLIYKVLEILRRVLQIFGRVAHPFELESGGMVVKLGQALHPPRVFGRGDLAKTYQRDAHALLRESGGELASVVPNP